MTSEFLAVDRRYLVLQYYVVEITYSQQVFDLYDLTQDKTLVRFYIY